MAEAEFTDWRFEPATSDDIAADPTKSASSSTKQPMHLDEIVVRIVGGRMYLWRTFDHEGEILDMVVQRRRDARGALRQCPRVAGVVRSQRASRQASG